MRISTLVAAPYFLLLSCSGSDNHDYVKRPTDTVKDAAGRETVILTPTDGTTAMNEIRTGSTTPQQLIAFARTAVGIPYRYASSDPKSGFDCSGFITYVFNHFNIAVPRSSVDFTDVDHQIEISEARHGDLILFTGTDPHDRTVGHMGIVITKAGEPLEFIHATSGKARGVPISPLNSGYRTRLVKVLRIFPQNDQ